MSLQFTPYCTDEDLAVRACGDYLVLCPKWQALAAGADGAFAPGSPWALTSASADFLAQGLQPGNVVVLTGPKPRFVGSGEPYAVQSVAAGSLTLKNIGLDAGRGQPPGTSAGLTGVLFTAATLAPQVEVACLEVNQLFGIDDNLPNRSPELVYDPNMQLKRVTALTVLRRQYEFLARGDKGDFVLKFKTTDAELGTATAQAKIKWGSLGQGDVPTSRFSMRFRR